MNRLHYLPLSADHLDVMAMLWANPRVIRYTAVEQPCTRQQSALRLQALLDGQRDLSSPTLFLVLCDATPCGVIGCPPLGRDGRRFGLFYQFLPELWGRGVGQDAVGRLLAQMRESYPQAVLVADVVEQNTASIRILQRLGFRQTGVRQNAFVRDGRAMPVLQFEAFLPDTKITT